MKVTKQHVLCLKVCSSHYNGAGISAPLVATSSLFITWEVNMVEPIASHTNADNYSPHTQAPTHTQPGKKETIRVLRYVCGRRTVRKRGWEKEKCENQGECCGQIRQKWRTVTQRLLCYNDIICFLWTSVNIFNYQYKKIKINEANYTFLWLWCGILFLSVVFLLWSNSMSFPQHWLSK